MNYKNRVCTSVGSSFANKLQTFILDAMNVYKVSSERISAVTAVIADHASMECLKSRSMPTFDIYLELSKESLSS